MALSAGDRLGPYEILAPLGAGGMGEVYRATDTKLGREVAIKTLPPEVTGDSERLGRFQREAHLLASLNHPHIAAIYGLEEADGKPFLVLELVEGEDLQQRLERGAIPVDEALEIARQIAEGLEEAHEKGIVHRDLKPANVKVTPDGKGKVKVLDFGLAKAWEGDSVTGSSSGLSQSPTLAHSGTQAGVILGTAAYMSPEQARGKPVDKRTDVWAFGVLVWEMLTGRTLFSGDTVTDIIAAVVKEEPDLKALPVKTPLTVRRLIARCLRKDPRTRLPDVGGVRLDLQDVLGGGAAEAGAEETPGGLPAAEGRQSRLRERWAWAMALVAAVTATVAFIHLSEVPEPRPTVRFTVDAPEGWSFSWPVPSPDGRHILIWGEQDTPEEGPAQEMYWLHSLESGISRPLGVAVGAQEVFSSPDGRSLGVLADGELRRLSLDDESVRRICTLPARLGFGGDWDQEGTILFGARSVRDSTGPGGLYTVPATGGEPKTLLTADRAQGEEFLAGPQFLPDGRRFLFVAVAFSGGQPTPLGVRVGSLDHPEERRLLVPDIGRLELAGGHVVFNLSDTLLAQQFDAERAELHGDPVAIASSAAVNNIDLGQFGVSPGGTLANTSGEEQEDRFQLAWLDRKGEPIGTVGAPGLYDQIVLSPDGKRVAVEILGDEGYDLWVIDVARGVPSRLTSDSANERDPVWSPDSQHVIFGSFAAGGLGLFRKGLSGEPALPIPIGDKANAEFRPIPTGLSSDGKTLLYKRLGQNKAWAFPLEGAGEAEVILNLEVGLNKLRVSPDGRWLAYTSQESGEWDVYVQPFRRSGERVRVSRDGGGSPRWRRDGKELFYRTADGMLMAVEVRGGTAGPEVSLPTALFDAGPFRQGSDTYAVSTDGQRFLVRQPIEEDSKLRTHVVLNWESLLE